MGVGLVELDDRVTYRTYKYAVFVSPMIFVQIGVFSPSSRQKRSKAPVMEASLSNGFNRGADAFLCWSRHVLPLPKTSRLPQEGLSSSLLPNWS